jgi:hypothetical protein
MWSPCVVECQMTREALTCSRYAVKGIGILILIALFFLLAISVVELSAWMRSLNAQPAEWFILLGMAIFMGIGVSVRAP